jgi:hypothetical protein
VQMRHNQAASKQVSPVMQENEHGVLMRLVPYPHN